MTRVEVLGIDIGGVIIDKVNDGTDTAFFGPNFLLTTAVEGAIETITQLVQHRFGERVHIVSKCGAAVQDKSRLWLAHRDFAGRTGTNPENLHFCLKRHEKAAICERLGITHFIDDKLEVLSYLRTVPNRFLFRPDPAEVLRHTTHLSGVKRVESWMEIERLLIS